MRISDLLPTGKEREAPFSQFITDLNPTRAAAVLSAESAIIKTGVQNLDEDYYFKKFAADQAAPQLTPSGVYSLTIQAARKITSGIAQTPPQTPDLEMMCEAVEQIMRIAATQRSAILEFIERSTPEDHLIGHIANVTILCIAMAQHMDWPAPAQKALGVGALLHDAGLILHQEEYLKARIFTQEERLIWNQYVAEGEALLKNFFPTLAAEPQIIIENIVLQSQERNGGQGFPCQLKREQISPEARLVGLCDTYESYTHARPYRARKLPFEALRQLMEFSGDMFDGNLIKLLRETLTIFPPGSYVKLSTGEVARVTDLNRKLPVRPIVKVVVNAEGGAARNEKIIDLAENQEISIENAVDECLLQLTDVSLLLELRTRRWWLG